MAMAGHGLPWPSWSVGGRQDARLWPSAQERTEHVAGVLANASGPHACPSGPLRAHCMPGTFLRGKSHLLINRGHLPGASFLLVLNLLMGLKVCESLKKTSALVLT